MARGKTIKILRTTKANLEAQKAASGLLAGEPYLITDEDRLAVGTGVNSYSEMAKKSEILLHRRIYIQTATPASPVEGDLWIDTN